MDTNVNPPRSASPQCVNFIKQQEGFRSHAYADVAGIATIGYGHRILPSENFPEGVTQAQAESILAHDVAIAEAAVINLVRVPLTQGQFDALVDFCFNLGSARLAGSTLLRLLNSGNFIAAAAQFTRWDMADGRVFPALLARRRGELAMWNQPATLLATSYQASQPQPSAQPASAD